MALKVEVDLSDDQLKKIAHYIVAFGLLPGGENKEKPLNEQYMTVKQVAKFTGVTEQTILNHIRSGLLKAERVGKFHRISRQSLKEYMTNGE